MITLEQVKNHPDVKVYITKANDFLGVIGYTEHGERHGKYVAKNARRILHELGYDENTCELAAIAGYIHDIGNVISRHSHPECSAYLANQFLKELNMPVEDRVLIMSADNKIITLKLEIDREISDLVEYFEIFIGRMVACRRAAKLLGCSFDVIVNGPT